eukprot:3181471-Prymnesium_polylepis.1
MCPFPISYPPLTPNLASNIGITYPSTIIQHATATLARHREMLSRAHDTPKRKRQSASTCEAHPMR